MQPRIKIAIDGFSSCGKSTLAKQLARQLGYAYIDSGAMYRAITLYFLRNTVDLTDTQKVTQALEDIEIAIEPGTQHDCVLLNGEDVTHRIREMLVADKVSDVATIKAVRTFAVAQQKAMSQAGGVVMDGRDIGTVVFPDAELKIFMTADPSIRVVRRFYELEAKSPQSVTLEEVQRNLELRDYIDSNREESPLRKADDARVLDNTNLNPDEQLELALQWSREVIREKAAAIPA